MLQVARDLLPQSLLSYVAFRVALRMTADRWTLGPADDAEPLPGYLAEVPFLRETAPAIQLEVLADTWNRHMARATYVASLLDESVLYAVSEFTAGLVEHQPERVLWAWRGGPLDIAVPIDRNLAADLRGLYLKLSNDGDFLLIGQLLDLSPDDAHEWKEKLGIASDRVEPLFEVLGRWYPSLELVSNLHGLMTTAEAQQLAELLRRPAHRDARPSGW